MTSAVGSRSGSVSVSGRSGSGPGARPRLKKSRFGGGPNLAVICIELLPAVLLCALFTALGVIHVSARVMVVRTGYQMSELEGENQVLAREHDRLKLELA